MHLRLPAFDHGVISLLWALFFGLFIWIGGSAVGYSSAMMFILGAVDRVSDVPLRPRLRRRRAAQALRSDERADEQARHRKSDLLLEARVRARPVVAEVGAVDEKQRCSTRGLWLEDSQLAHVSEVSACYRTARSLAGGKQVTQVRDVERRTTPTRARRGTPPRSQQRHARRHARRLQPRGRSKTARPRGRATRD